MAGLLGDIYSYGNTLKRKVNGLLADPVGTAQQFVGQLGDDTNTNINNMLVGYGMFGNKSVLADPKQVQQARNALADYGAQTGMAAVTVWHGSPHKFDKFDSSTDNRGVGGTWATDSKPYAEWIAGKSPDKRGNVYKVDADIKNPSIFDVMDEAKKVADEIGIPPPTNPLEAQELLSGGMGWDTVVSDALHEAKTKGFDALHIKNFNDAYHSNPFETTSAYVIPNENLLKILERNGKPINQLKGLLGE